MNNLWTDYYLQPIDFERAEANGISARLLKDRYYYKNWNKERAMTEPPVKQLPKELIEQAKAHGIELRTLHWRLQNTDLTPKEAATLSTEEMFERRIARQSTVLSAEIKALAEKNGLQYMTVYRRVKNGMDPVKAATQPPLPPGERARKRWNQQPRSGLMK